ncbi:hypothetical protein GCM10022377_09530 [Zhihengliuella alba]|uniref:DUF308 domain-containing protein n=1 Tax=Zhihengliuella alba TaxID=547018 RepID=A0ABP7D379_9MICC
MNNPDIPDHGRRPEAADEQRTAEEYAADEQPTRPIHDEQPARPLQGERPTPEGTVGADPAWSPPAPPVPAQRPIKRGIPLGTLVFGLASLVVAVALLANAFLDIAVNPAIVVVLILLGAGAIMVIGGIAATRRRRDAEDHRPGSDPYNADTTDPHVRG